MYALSISLFLLYSKTFSAVVKYKLAFIIGKNLNKLLLF